MPDVVASEPLPAAAAPPVAVAPPPRRWFGLLFLEWTVANIGYYGFQSILSVYFLTTLHLRAAEAATLILVTSASFRLNRLFLAPLIDRLRPRTAVFAALLLGAAGFVGLGSTTRPAFIFVLLPVVGIGGATNTIVVKTLAAERSSTQRSALMRYASLSTGLNIAAALGPVIANEIFVAGAPRWVFLLAAVTYASAGFIVLAIPATVHQSVTRPRWFVTVRSLLRVADVRRALVLTAIAFVFYAQLFTTFPVFATDVLKVPNLRGSFFALNAVVVMAGQIPLGYVAHRRGWRGLRLVTAGYATFCAGFTLMWLVPSVQLGYVSVFLWTVGEMLVMPTIDSLMAEATVSHQRVVAFSLAGVAMTVGDGVGGALSTGLAGRLLATGHLRELYAFVTVAGLALLVLVVLAYRRCLARPEAAG